MIDKILEFGKMEEGLMENLASIDQFFIQALSGELELAERQKQDDRKQKLEKLAHMIQEMTTPPELKVLDKLIVAADKEDELKELIIDLDDQIYPQVIDYMTSIIGQYEERIDSSTDDDKNELEESLEKIKLVYNAVLKHSMKMKMSDGG